MALNDDNGARKLTLLRLNRPKQETSEQQEVERRLTVDKLVDEEGWNTLSRELALMLKRVETVVDESETRLAE